MTWLLLRHARRYELAIDRMRGALRSFDVDVSAAPPPGG